MIWRPGHDARRYSQCERRRGDKESFEMGRISMKELDERETIHR